MNREIILLSERNQAQRPRIVIPLVRNIQNRKIHRDPKEMVVARGLGVGMEKNYLMDMEVYFGGMQKF